MMTAIMSEENKGEQDKVTLTEDKLRKYFPKSQEFVPKFEGESRFGILNFKNQ